MRWSVRRLVQAGITAAFTAMMMAAAPSAASAADPMLLFVDGRHVELNSPPVVIQDRTLIPVRGFFEFLGATVTWNGEAQSVTVDTGSTTVDLTIGRTAARVNGQAITLDVPAQIIEGRTYVPLRAIAESIGAQVIWAPPDTIVVHTARQTVSRSGTRRAVPVPVPAPRSGDRLVSAARQLVGTPYTWGGTSPDDGFDCSGFTQYVAGQAGIKIPRTSQEQATVGVKVGRSELLPGDLVFFETYGSGPTHVGIYAGGNQFINAMNENTGVVTKSMDSAYWKARYLYARRIIR